MPLNRLLGGGDGSLRRAGEAARLLATLPFGGTPAFDPIAVDGVRGGPSVVFPLVPVVEPLPPAPRSRDAMASMPRYVYL